MSPPPRLPSRTRNASRRNRLTHLHQGAGGGVAATVVQVCEPDSAGSDRGQGSVGEAVALRRPERSESFARRSLCLSVLTWLRLPIGLGLPSCSHPSRSHASAASRGAPSTEPLPAGTSPPRGSAIACVSALRSSIAGSPRASSVTLLSSPTYSLGVRRLRAVACDPCSAT